MKQRAGSRKERILRAVGPGAEDAYERCLAEARASNDEAAGDLSRRGFVKLVSVAAVAAAAGVPLSACNAGEVITGETTVVDDWGRELTLPAPDTVEKVFFTSALAEVFVYTLNPDLIAGICSSYNSDQLKYLPDRIAEVPILGTANNGGTVDYETLMAEGIQIIFSISGVDLTEGNLSDAERVQEATGIPVVLIDGQFDKIADAYRFLGECIGEEDRAEVVGQWCETTHAEVVEALSGLAEEDKITFYYAEGPEGLQTEPDESQHALCFKVAGGKNIADVEIGGALGMSNVNLEQVMAWDPQVIIAWATDYGGGYDDILTNDGWAGITAVKNGNVFSMPYLPFSWCDRPPGINRLIGVQWVANLLYPQLYDIDLLEVTKEFYSTMYWTELSDEQAQEILGDNYPRRDIVL